VTAGAAAAERTPAGATPHQPHVTSLTVAAAALLCCFPCSCCAAAAAIAAAACFQATCLLVLWLELPAAVQQRPWRRCAWLPWQVRQNTIQLAAAAAALYPHVAECHQHTCALLSCLALLPPGSNRQRLLAAWHGLQHAMLHTRTQFCALLLLLLCSCRRTAAWLQPAVSCAGLDC
jgi:hypothetical protein